MADTIVTVTRANTSELYQPLVVDLAVSGTATFGTDYTVLGATSFNATSASVTIPANQTSKTITLSSVADTIFEPDETVVLTVVPTAGVSSGNGNVTWTILNDDASSAIGNILSLRFEGSSIIDDNGKTVINNAVTLSTTDPFSGLQSGEFKLANNSRLSVNLGGQLSLGDFTIKTAVKFSQSPNNEYIFDFGYNIFRLAWYAGNWNMYDSSVGFFLPYTHTPVINTWYKIAICRSGVGAARTVRMYFNDVLVASTSVTNFNLNTPNLYIGNSGGQNVALNGFLDNFAISNFAEFN